MLIRFLGLEVVPAIPRLSLPLRKYVQILYKISIMMGVKKSKKVTVKTLRKRLGMNQTQFSIALGCGARHATVSDWENGKAIPDWLSHAKALNALLKEADMSWDEILDDIAS